MYIKRGVLYQVHRAIWLIYHSCTAYGTCWTLVENGERKLTKPWIFKTRCSYNCHNNLIVNEFMLRGVYPASIKQSLWLNWNMYPQWIVDLLFKTGYSYSCYDNLIVNEFKLRGGYPASTKQSSLLNSNMYHQWIVDIL